MIPETSISITTFNIGGGLSDFAMQCRHLSLQANEKEFRAPTDKERNDAEITTAESLLKNPSDIYCLQEVNTFDRPIINSLKAANYQFLCIHAKGKGGQEKGKLLYDDSGNPILRSTVIAFRSDRFTLVADHSNDKDNAPIAELKHNETQEHIAVAAMHVSGLELAVKPIDPNDGIDGDSQCVSVAQKLNTLSHCRFLIAGADWNANPDHYAGAKDILIPTYKHRFKAFTDCGFDVQRSYQPTQVNLCPARDVPRGSVRVDYRERELDLFVTKEATTEISLLARIVAFIKSLFYSYQATRIDVSCPLEFSRKQHCSDHRPVTIAITTVQPARISQLCTGISNLFHRLLK